MRKSWGATSWPLNDRCVLFYRFSYTKTAWHYTRHSFFDVRFSQISHGNVWCNAGQLIYLLHEMYKTRPPPPKLQTYARLCRFLTPFARLENLEYSLLVAVAHRKLLHSPIKLLPPPKRVGEALWRPNLTYSRSVIWIRGSDTCAKAASIIE